MAKAIEVLDQGMDEAGSQGSINKLSDRISAAKEILSRTGIGKNNEDEESKVMIINMFASPGTRPKGEEHKEIVQITQHIGSGKSPEKRYFTVSEFEEMNAVDEGKTINMVGLDKE